MFYITGIDKYFYKMNFRKKYLNLPDTYRNIETAMESVWEVVARFIRNNQLQMQAQQKSRLGSAVEQSQQLYVGFEKGLNENSSSDW